MTSDALALPPDTDVLTIVDPHVHIWDLGTRLYPLRERRRAAGDATVGDYFVADLLHEIGRAHV